MSQRSQPYSMKIKEKLMMIIKTYRPVCWHIRTYPKWPTCKDLEWMTPSLISPRLSLRILETPCRHRYDKWAIKTTAVAMSWTDCLTAIKTSKRNKWLPWQGWSRSNIKLAVKWPHLRHKRGKRWTQHRHQGSRPTEEVSPMRATYRPL